MRNCIVSKRSPDPFIEERGLLEAETSLANRRYIFPGLAFGAHLVKSGQVTDAMLTAAAEALPKLLTDEDLEAARVYPDLNNIRQAICIRHDWKELRCTRFKCLCFGAAVDHVLAAEDTSGWLNGLLLRVCQQNIMSMWKEI